MGKKKRKRRRRFKGAIAELAKELQQNTPKSEQWFQREWKRLEMEHEADQYNTVFERFIPDVVNHVYRYAIEVDGSIHNRKDVRRNDLRKNGFFQRKGYELFRLKAFDTEGLYGLCELIERHRYRIDNPPPKPVVKPILRKGAA